MPSILKNISLKPFNTFGIEAKCAYFVEIHKEEELNELVKNPIYISKKKFILGGGSNILLTKDFDGLVIKISIKGIEIKKQTPEHTWLKVGAGDNWHQFVVYCVNNNYAGIENLSLIPGTVGAAPMQNIGAYGVEIKDVFDSLEAFDLVTGKKHTFKNEDCRFGYRESVFKNVYKNRFIITSVTFKLNSKPTFHTSYGAIQQTLDKNGVKELSIKAISDAVIEIRQSKLPNTALLGNSGSFFKNPEIPNATLEELKKSYPDIPNYKVSDTTSKLAAGWLIEQCGWKGKKVGNTGSHKDQALVLVNYGNATGKEIWNLAIEIQKSVVEKFGIDITPEVNII